MKKIDIDILNKNCNDPVCINGRNYYNKQGSSLEAWNNCKNPEWLIWAAERLGIDKRKMYLAVSICLHQIRDKFKRNSNSGNIMFAKEHDINYTCFLYGRGKLSESFIINESEKFNIEHKFHSDISFFGCISLMLDGYFQECTYQAVESYSYQAYKTAERVQSLEAGIFKSFRKGRLLSKPSKVYKKSPVEIEKETKRTIREKFCNIIRGILTEEIETKLKNF